MAIASEVISLPSGWVTLTRYVRVPAVSNRTDLVSPVSGVSSQSSLPSRCQRYLGVPSGGLLIWAVIVTESPVAGSSRSVLTETVVSRVAARVWVAVPAMLIVAAAPSIEALALVGVSLSRSERVIVNVSVGSSVSSITIGMDTAWLRRLPWKVRVPLLAP